MKKTAGRFIPPMLAFLAWPAAARAQGALKPPAALAALEQASQSAPAGSPEGLAAQGAGWSDGARPGRAVLAVDDAPGVLQDVPNISPKKDGRRRRTEVPPIDDGRVRGSQDERYVQFSYGFLEVQKPALDLLMGSWPMKILGGLLGAVLFVPAVIWGGIRAFF